MGTMEGTYVLNAFQGREKSITAVGIGEQPSEVMIITTEELNYSSDSTVDVTDEAILLINQVLGKSVKSN